MGEEKKEEEKKEEEKKSSETEVVKEEKKAEEEKKEEEAPPPPPPPPPQIVIKVDMHCEACARKVARAVKGFQGVEEVTADYKASKVVVKGKAADPVKVCERIQKKSGKKVELISPLPKPPEPADQKKDEPKQEPKEDKQKQEPPVVVTVVLKVGMHCDACAQALQKRIRKIQGVESVTTDLPNDQVTVKGVVDPTKLVNEIYRKTKKQAIIVKDESEEKKEEEKKVEDEKKEEGKEGEKKEGGEEEEEEKKSSEIKKSEYMPPKYYMEYSYPPQMFSDENPNACSVM